MPAAIITLAEGRLYALSHPYTLDGRVSSHPRSARGYAPAQCYLLLDGQDALLMDTGYSVHEQALLEQLDELLPTDARLSVYVTRIGEFGSICNVRAIAERYSLQTLYGNQLNPTRWVDFRPGHSAYGDPVGGGALAQARASVIRNGDSLTLGDGERRRIRAFTAPLRLLPALWHYDEATRTLFTADVFTHVWRLVEEGPWTATAADTPMSTEALQEYLLGNRFWWLAGARIENIRSEMERIFDEFDVEIIAPGWGCALVGRDVVRQHHELLQETLLSLAAEANEAVYPDWHPAEAND